MKQNLIKVNMLGSFSVEISGNIIDDSKGRTYKAWLLLAYLLYCRDRMVSGNELIKVLYGDEDRENPQNAFRAVLHRVRTLLDSLDSGSGDIILYRDGGYCINPEFEVESDVERFNEFCQAGISADNEERRAEYFLQAAALYRGPFLEKLSSEAWARSVAVFYHEKYLTLIKEVLSVLQTKKRTKDIIGLCMAALQFESYDEELYLYLMRNLLESGNRQDVISVYDKICKLFMEDFGVLPSEELRSLYNQAVRDSGERYCSVDDLQETLRDKDTLYGALYCDYDVFKVLYNATARLLDRTGAVVHVCMFSLTDEKNGPLHKRSREIAMDNFQELIRTSLRRGDVFTRCSNSQFAVLLQLANYENSCMVCERINRAYRRAYPHSPARITYSVRAVQPE